MSSVKGYPVCCPASIKALWRGWLVFPLVTWRGPLPPRYLQSKRQTKVSKEVSPRSSPLAMTIWSDHLIKAFELAGNLKKRVNLNVTCFLPARDSELSWNKAGSAHSPSRRLLLSATGCSPQRVRGCTPWRSARTSRPRHGPSASTTPGRPCWPGAKCGSTSYTWNTKKDRRAG